MIENKPDSSPEKGDLDENQLERMSDKKTDEQQGGSLNFSN